MNKENNYSNYAIEININSSIETIFVDTNIYRLPEPHTPVIVYRPQVPSGLL